MNFMRTAVLLAALTALFMVVGFALGGRGGAALALAFAVATNLFAYWNSDRLALASVDAHEVDASIAPDLVADVAELARRAGVPMPRVYVVESPQPNAFATGRDPEHAAVAINTGLSAALTRQERAGVIAHELAHIKHRDTLTMTIAATLAGAVSSIANFGLFFGGRRDGGVGPVGAIALAILAPIAAMIVQMAVSRSREYVADRSGAEICGNPLWLAAALQKIEQGAAVIPDAAVEARPTMAHMFIINPLASGPRDNLFSTHPATENRVAALVALAQEMGVGAYQPQDRPQGQSRTSDHSGQGWSPFRDETTRPQGGFLDGGGLFGENRQGRKGPWG